MTTHSKTQGVPLLTGAALAKEDGKAFFLIFCVAFMAFLAIALVGVLLGCQWRAWLPGAEGVKSVTGGVKAAVYTFMSHLQ
jgi:light-harvesting complex 1 beta chain